MPQRLALRLTPLVAVAFLAGCGENGITAGDAKGVLDQYCVGCHNEAERTSELSLERIDFAHVGADAKVLERVVRKLRIRTMPPQGEPRPEAATYDAFVAWLERELDDAAAPNPGRPALRRLNRAEYANAIRDLLALDVDVAQLLPPDDAAFGFDNIGDLLGVSPALLERYLGAADRVSALALGDPATATGAVTYATRGDQSQAQHLEGLPLGTVGGLGVDHYFPLDGEYELGVALLRTNLEAIRGLEHSHQLEIAVDGERVLLETIGGDLGPGEPGLTITQRSDAVDAKLKTRVFVAAGERRVTAAFVRKIGAGTNRLRPFDRSNAGTYDSTGRPHVKTLTVTGPYDATGAGTTASRRRILTCTPSGAEDDAGRDARGRATQARAGMPEVGQSREQLPRAVAEARCAREILTTLARRAYRRPVDDADLERLMPFYHDGADQSFEAGIQLALRRLLASPTFVFRVEQDPADVEPGTAYRIGDLELATRLSFFLWSSIPDDALLELAAAGRLHEPDVIERETRRLLADPRAEALVDNFAGQWLHLRNLDNFHPNTDAFPDFDNDLRQAARRETELFFASLLRDDRSVLELLTADYTFVDERLARHYGIANVYGSQFRRVALGPGLEPRRGLLGKAGILMATSHPDRTAPTLRGKWIMENLLGTPPPPPPAAVPPLETEVGSAPRTMRERMERHRATPACASCHALVDPLGFAMDNFDAIGGWRDYDASNVIDASGALPDGTPVAGVTELREALLADPQLFAGTVTEKLLTYALGRGLQHYDQPVVRGILRDAEANDYRFSALVIGIVRSTPFTMRTR
jgi:hypothetical protein